MKILSRYHEFSQSSYDKPKDYLAFGLNTGLVLVENNTLLNLEPGCVYNFTNVTFLITQLYYHVIDAKSKIEIMHGAKVAKEIDPKIITDHHIQCMKGLTLKIKNALHSLKQYHNDCSDVARYNVNHNCNESDVLFHPVRRMFNEESKFINNPNNILALIQDSNNYTHHSGTTSLFLDC